MERRKAGKRENQASLQGTQAPTPPSLASVPLLEEFDTKSPYNGTVCLVARQGGETHSSTTQPSRGGDTSQPWRSLHATNGRVIRGALCRWREALRKSSGVRRICSEKMSL